MNPARNRRQKVLHLGNSVVNAIMTVAQGFACASSPLSPGFGNEFNAGLQQAFAKYLVLGREYIRKCTHNSYFFPRSAARIALHRAPKQSSWVSISEGPPFIFWVSPACGRLTRGIAWLAGVFAPGSSVERDLKSQMTCNESDSYHLAA